MNDWPPDVSITAPDDGATVAATATASASCEQLRAGGIDPRKNVLFLLEVFAERGFHGVRVDDVVRRAGISHGTFYLYFSNKEDLFGALTAEVATLAGVSRSLASLVIRGAPGPRSSPTGICRSGSAPMLRR